MFRKIIIVSIVLFVTLFAVVAGIFWSMTNYDTEVRHPVDLIVVLGGGIGQRIKKACQLQNEEYCRAKKLLITGIPVNPEKVIHLDQRLKYLKEHPEIHYDAGYTNETKNTWDEILYIKRYMLKNGYRSTIVVTDPQHVARVRMTLERVGNFKEAEMEYIVVSYKKVDFIRCFLNDKSFRNYALLEVVKRLGYEVKALGYNIALRIKKI